MCKRLFKNCHHLLWVRSPKGYRAFTSHQRMDPSSPLDASISPSGAQDILPTGLECPPISCELASVSKSQSQMVLSSAPIASIFSFGDQAIHLNEVFETISGW